MSSSRVIIDMDSKRELVIPNSEPYIPHENEDPQLIEPNSEMNSSFLSNFTSNMNVEIKEEPNMPVYLGELYRAGSPEPLYRPHVLQEIFQIDQWTRNIIPNIPNPYYVHHNYNIGVPNINTQLENWIPPAPIGFNPFNDPNYFVPAPTMNINKIPTINEANGAEPLKKRRGRPKKNNSQALNNLLITEIKNKQSTRRPYTRKNKQIDTELETLPVVIPQKRPVGRPRLNRKELDKPKKQPQKKKTEEEKEEEEECSVLMPLVVPAEQEFKTISHEFAPISGGEEPIKILKIPTKNFLMPFDQKFRSLKSLTESFDFNFKYKNTDFNSLRTHLGFPEKLPLLMNQLSWDPKASYTDIAKYGCMKCSMCFRYQYDFVVHECEGKELASFCTNCWTMFPHRPRKKRRKNGMKYILSDEEESDRVPHTCDPSTSLQCSECNSQFVNSFDLLQHYNLHYF